MKKKGVGEHALPYPPSERNQAMKIKLPRGIEFSLNEIPKNLEEQVQRSFFEYTEGTNPEYMFLDKLSYIDRCLELLHSEADGSTEVRKLVKEDIAYQLDECDELPNESDYLSIEFMERCYDRGKEKHSLYSHYYTDNHHENEKIMLVLSRVIDTVMRCRKAVRDEGR